MKKLVVITGASSGIGMECAKDFQRLVILYCLLQEEKSLWID